MHRFFRFISAILWLVTSLLGLSLIGVSSVYLYLKPDLPSVQQLRDIKLQVPLRIYSRDEKLIAEFGEKRRTPVTIDDVPPLLVQAFLAAEDARFLEHHGVDFKGLTRAVVELASSGSIQSGGSTITMQVAKNFFLSSERTFKRKFTEILLALQIEHDMDKPEILELYLNKIYLGNRAYGIEAAAQAYYGKSVSQLTIAEMAMIAGLPKAPSAYNPIANPERAMIRRDWILSRMHELGFIDTNTLSQALSEPNTARYHGAETELDAPHIAEMVRADLFSRYGERIYTDGFVVRTTIPSELQNTAARALRNGLEAYDRRHGFRGAVDHWNLDTLPADLQDRQLQRLPQIADLFPALVTDMNAEGINVNVRDNGTRHIPWGSLQWARKYISADRRGPAPKTPSDILKRGDIIYVRLGQTDTTEAQFVQIPEVQGALVALDAHTGDILALSGGYSYHQSKYNRAIQAARQPGSTFKPFLYLAALENGATAATVINDAPLVFQEAGMRTAWRPQNASGRFYGPTRLREALYFSRNLVSVRLLQDIGIDRTLDYISRLGMDMNSFPRSLSLSLGTGSMPPLELTRAFAVIANGGYRIKTRFIAEITNLEGAQIYVAPKVELCDDCTADTTQSVMFDTSSDSPGESVEIAPRVADPRAVYILHSMLKDVITKGTGRRALELNRSDLAGKTGTTNEQKDAWFVGFNHSIAAAAWVGFDQPASLGSNEYGGIAALPIWIDFMRTALKDTPPSNMPQPPGIVSVKIDAQTGQRAGPDTEEAIFELFKEEDAPTEEVALPDIGPSLDGESGFLPQQLF